MFLRRVRSGLGHDRQPRAARSQGPGRCRPGGRPPVAGKDTRPLSPRDVPSATERLRLIPLYFHRVEREWGRPRRAARGPHAGQAALQCRGRRPEDGGGGGGPCRRRQGPGAVAANSRHQEPTHGGVGAGRSVAGAQRPTLHPVSEGPQAGSPSVSGNSTSGATGRRGQGPAPSEGPGVGGRAPRCSSACHLRVLALTG